MTYNLDLTEGLIPAHAGKTESENRPDTGEEAHPRSRGENTPAAKLPAMSTGSSPLTRGKLKPVDDRADRRRLIPAHAGKTCPRRASTWR